MITIIEKGTSKEKIRLALKNRQIKIKAPDLQKYCGTIKLKEDPLKIQKEWRNEWE